MDIYTDMKDRILDRIVRFDILLGITAITIALIAAFFSVYGIANLFAGAFLLTAVMASSLEIGKLVGVTFLYRYWDKTQNFLKTYLSIAIIILMLVTSIGIFGFLSSAYQRSSLEFKVGQEKIVMIEGRKTYLNDKIIQSNIRVQTLNDMRKVQENRLSETLTNAFLTRNPIQLKEIQDQTVDMVKSADDSIKIEQDKIQSTTDEIQKIDQQVNDLKFASAGKKDIRTFQFVAEQFGTTLDKVAKWFIFTLIFVFDPLAVALILAYNIVAYKRVDEVTINPQPDPLKEQTTKVEKMENSPIVSSPTPVSETPTIVEPVLTPAPTPAPVAPIHHQQPWR